MFNIIFLVSSYKIKFNAVPNHKKKDSLLYSTTREISTKPDTSRVALHIAGCNSLCQFKVEWPWGHKLFDNLIGDSLPSILVFPNETSQDCNQLLLELSCQHLTTLVRLGEREPREEVNVLSATEQNREDNNRIWL